MRYGFLKKSNLNTTKRSRLFFIYTGLYLYLLFCLLFSSRFCFCQEQSFQNNLVDSKKSESLDQNQKIDPEANNTGKDVNKNEIKKENKNKNKNETQNVKQSEFNVLGYQKALNDFIDNKYGSYVSSILGIHSDLQEFLSARKMEDVSKFKNQYDKLIKSNDTSLKLLSLDELNQMLKLDITQNTNHQSTTNLDVIELLKDNGLNQDHKITDDDFYRIYKLENILAAKELIPARERVSSLYNLTYLYLRANLELISSKYGVEFLKQALSYYSEFRQQIIDVLFLLGDINVYDVSKIKEVLLSYIYKNTKDNVPELKSDETKDLNDSTNSTNSTNSTDDKEFVDGSSFESVTSTEMKKNIDDEGSVEYQFIKFLSCVLLYKLNYKSDGDEVLSLFKEISKVDNFNFKIASSYYIAKIYMDQKKIKDAQTVSEDILHLEQLQVKPVRSPREDKNIKDDLDQNSKYLRSYLEEIRLLLAYIYAENKDYKASISILDRVDETSLNYEFVLFFKIYLSYLIEDTTFVRYASSFLIEYPYSYYSFDVKLLLWENQKTRASLSLENLKSDLEYRLKLISSKKKQFVSLTKDYKGITASYLNLAKLFKDNAKYFQLVKEKKLENIDQTIIELKKVIDHTLSIHTSKIPDQISLLDRVAGVGFYISDILKIGVDIVEKEYEIVKKYLSPKDSLVILDKLNSIKDKVLSTSNTTLTDDNYELKLVCKYLKNDIKSLSSRGYKKQVVEKIIEDITRFEEETRFIQKDKSESMKNSITEILTELKDFRKNLLVNLNPVSDEDSKGLILSSKEFERFLGSTSLYIEQVELWQINLEKYVLDNLSSIKNLLVTSIDQLETLEDISKKYIADLSKVELFDYMSFVLNKKLKQIDELTLQSDLGSFKELNENILFETKFLELYSKEQNILERVRKNEN